MLKIVIDLYNGSKEVPLPPEKLDTLDKVREVVDHMFKSLTINDLIMLHRFRIVYDDKSQEEIAKMIRDEIVKKFRELFMSLILLEVDIHVEDNVSVMLYDEIKKNEELIKRLEKFLSSV